MIIPFWAKGVALLGVVAALILSGWFGGVDHERGIWEKRQNELLRIQVAQSESARRETTRLQAEVDDANKALSEARAANVAAGERYRNLTDRVRQSVTTVARGTSDDTLATCNARATALGDVLERALRTSEVCAAKAEPIADDTRALRAAWPLTDN